jgi:hypothetical protein
VQEMEVLADVMSAIQALPVDIRELFLPSQYAHVQLEELNGYLSEAQAATSRELSGFHVPTIRDVLKRLQREVLASAIIVYEKSVYGRASICVAHAGEIFWFFDSHASTQARSARMVTTSVLDVMHDFICQDFFGVDPVWVDTNTEADNEDYFYVTYLYPTQTLLYS